MTPRMDNELKVSPFYTSYTEIYHQNMSLGFCLITLKNVQDPLSIKGMQILVLNLTITAFLQTGMSVHITLEVGYKSVDKKQMC